MSVTDHRDIVAALCDVPGVTDAEVEPDADGGLGQLRLGLEPGVDEVAVAMRVGRLLRERFGLGVDADRVQIIEEPQILLPGSAGTAAAASVAAVASADAAGDAAGERPADTTASAGSTAFSASFSLAAGSLSGQGASGDGPGQALGSRPAISRLDLLSAGLDVTATVTLTADGCAAAGECRGSASPSGVNRAVATATLRAVEQLAGGTARFELDHLEVSRLGADRIVLVALTMLSSRGTERLTGAASVSEDVRQTVIRATLDALNRRLETLRF